MDTHEKQICRFGVDCFAYQRIQRSGNIRDKDIAHVSEFIHGGWTCTKCTWNNQSNLQACVMCHRPKTIEKNKLIKPMPLCRLKVHQDYYTPLLSDYLSKTVPINVIHECILSFVCGDLDKNDENEYQKQKIKRFLSRFDANKDKIILLNDLHDKMTQNEAIDCIESFNINKEKKLNICNVYSVWYDWNIGDSHKWTGYEKAFYIGQIKTTLSHHPYLYFTAHYTATWSKDKDTFIVSVTLSNSLGQFLDHAMKLEETKSTCTSIY
eukprot:326465_1